MDPNFRIGQEFRLEHRHGDGTWSELHAEHDSVAHDSERSWLRRRIFRCDCGEEVAVTTGGDVDEIVGEASR